MALHSPLHTFLHLACFLPSAKALNTLISFAWTEASTNILYARGPMLKRHLLATTGVMVRTYNPNTTQESQKKRKSEASQPGSPSDSPAISQSQFICKETGTLRQERACAVSFKSCQTRSVAMAVMFTACGAQRTLGGICKVWEKFVIKQLLLPPSPQICTDSSLPLMDLANSSGDCFRIW